MASYGPGKAFHKTLAAGVQDQVTISAWFPEIEIINQSGNNPIYFTTNGDDVTVAADDADVVSAGVGSSVTIKTSLSSGNEVVKLISTTAESYSVIGREGTGKVRS